ncbi:MAG TPA: hypothetical protein VH115_07375, partial [Solirubrobacteraceae bacterium]|nr:hypothetical protein [Solirubrobacteraceae bacterium]
EATERAGRAHYPVGAAAAIEASGMVGELPGALDDLARARVSYRELGRPLESARCALLLGQRGLDHDRERALRALEDAATEFDELGVEHRAARARELAGATAASA